MPSMGGVRTGCAYLKGCHIALACDTRSSRLDAIARRDVRARALQHDVHGAIFLLRKLDRALHVRLLPRALQDVCEVEFLEDRRRALRPLRLELHAERLDRLPLLLEDVDDVDHRASARSEHDGLERRGALADLALPGDVEEDLPAGVAGRLEFRG